ncbi:hypothetical protein GDO81_005045 [Engystomops pustulosus]|uniref:Uncharacterized protein n=1 Tax=Engystomops pustulosus TaxID=76066 RepID=A0AAV7CKY4_ENGPU|nr:hypothetical protein GDO81_005045 [Engystomops pustulosus]
MSKLERQHSNKVFVVKGVKSKRSSLLISSPISSSSSFFMASIDPGTSISINEKGLLDGKSETNPSNEAQDFSTDENTSTSTEEVACEESIIIQGAEELEESVSQNIVECVQDDTSLPKETESLETETESDSKHDPKEISQKHQIVRYEKMSENVTQNNTDISTQGATEDKIILKTPDNSSKIVEEEVHEGANDTKQVVTENLKDGDSQKGAGGTQASCVESPKTDLKESDNGNENTVSREEGDAEDTFSSDQHQTRAEHLTREVPSEDVAEGNNCERQTKSPSSVQSTSQPFPTHELQISNEELTSSVAESYKSCPTDKVTDQSDAPSSSVPTSCPIYPTVEVRDSRDEPLVPNSCTLCPTNEGKQDEIDAPSSSDPHPCQSCSTDNVNQNLNNEPSEKTTGTLQSESAGKDEMMTQL